MRPTRDFAPSARSSPVSTTARDDHAVTLASDQRPELDGETPHARLWRGLAVYLLRLLVVGAGLSAVTYGYQLLLGGPEPARPYAFYFPWEFFSYGAVLLTAATLGRGRREWTMAAVSAVCLFYLWTVCPLLVAWVAVLIPTLYFLLGPEDVPDQAASCRFWGGIFVGLIVLPKVVQGVAFHFVHGSVLDVNQNLFAGLCLRYAYYYYERRRGLVLAGGFWEHVAYLLFVPQITGMLNVPPAEMSARWGFGAATLGRGFVGVAWALAKIPVILFLERRVLPAWGYDRGFAALRTAPWWSLWACLLTTYLEWAVLVSAKFDLMAALFRFFGVNVDDNFNWPLLATSPLALWRRWNVYNRRLLLKFVYFPLGGSKAHVYRNIMATFLASALLLHTGYLGSPWLGLNPLQLRDWLVYFAAQGGLVCVAYWWVNRPFWAHLPPAARRGLATAGWVFTLGSSAWLHVLPLAAGNLLNNDAAPITGMWERLELMARALGWPG